MDAKTNSDKLQAAWDAFNAGDFSVSRNLADELRFQELDSSEATELEELENDLEEEGGW